ncbi:MAG: hypothetical protein GVY08_14735 [Bacteroidetes bacterium]|jgi:hypothetical protein|nr:hypothetical protein [Bacteroidota bacterium]
MYENIFRYCIIGSSLIFLFFGILIGIFTFNEIDSQKRETINLSGGKYVRLVFIGSSKCYFSNTRKTIRTIKNIKLFLKKFLDDKNVEFITTGTSFDYSSSDAITHLDKTGPYDEVLVGNGPFNLGIMQYVSGKSPTPKIILLLEEYESELVGLNMKNFIDSQSSIKTYTGQFEIQNLYEYLISNNEDEILEYLNIKL